MTLALAVIAPLALALATRSLAPVRAAVLALQLEALVVALAAPWLAARVLEDDSTGEGTLLPTLRAAALPAGVVALVVVVACAVRGAPSVVDALLAQVLIALVGAGLFALALAAGTRGRPARGLVAGLGAAALLLGLPYVGGEAIAALPSQIEGSAVSWLVAASPPVVLGATFGGADVLRSPVLYDRFRPGQDVPFAYASVASALALHATVALALVGLAFFLRRRVAKLRAPAVAPALALVLLLVAPGRADAQAFGGGADAGTPAEGDIGPMQTRVRLGYIVPFIDGHIQMYGLAAPSSEFQLQDDLDLHLSYAVPTFELELGWKGAGRVWAEYWEVSYQGDFLSPTPVEAAFRNITIPATEVGLVEYRFRTVALRGAVEIPILDFITLEIIGSTRYVHWYTKVRAPRNFLQDSANLDAILPGIGPGVDVFIFDKVYVYGDILWLDFSAGPIGDLFGQEKGPKVKYREAHAGVRLELLDEAHIGLEFYLLETAVEDDRHDYSQRIMGPRIWVGVQF